MSDNRIRLAGIAYESLVNGPGMRRVLFSQGCRHNCKGCFNPDTHSFEGGELKDMDIIIKGILENPMLRGVTFSGGDPIEQADKFAYIAKAVKGAGLDIWCYTGYTFEYLKSHIKDMVGVEELFKYIDVLVDGRFEEDKKDTHIKFRGSKNQRIIDVRKSLESDKIEVLNYD